MDKLVFVGSEAEGYYSGAYDCFGVFVSADVYKKHGEMLDETFIGRSHGEIDGKHSDVEGDSFVKQFDNMAQVAEFLNRTDADYEVYNFSEYVGDGEYSDAVVEEVFEHIREIEERIKSGIKTYKTVLFTLSEADEVKVRKFIASLGSAEGAIK